MELLTDVAIRSQELSKHDFQEDRWRWACSVRGTSPYYVSPTRLSMSRSMALPEQNTYGVERMPEIAVPSDVGIDEGW